MCRIKGLLDRTRVKSKIIKLYIICMNGGEIMGKFDLKKIFKIMQIGVCIAVSVLSTLSEIINADEK